METTPQARQYILCNASIHLHDLFNYKDRLVIISELSWEMKLNVWKQCKIAAGLCWGYVSNKKEPIELELDEYIK